MLSYDVSTLVTKYLLNVKILPQDLPDTTCETIAKIEYSVMTSKIAAMLPTKNQLDGITDVLRGFEEQ